MNNEKIYKGVLLEELDKETSMAHSAFFEEDKGTEYFDILLSRDKATLSPEQFLSISALNSVANMNYQICNGGLDQYYFNGYDREREPFDKNDVLRVNKYGQVQMLRELQAFGVELFPEKEVENQQLKRVISDFENSYYEEPEDDWEYHDDNTLVAPDDFDRRYYKINDYLENLIEAYAQYLNKTIDQRPSLESLKRSAKERLEEKNSNHSDNAKSHKTLEQER